ncbi:MAG: FtsQ-type POTRA domain-containing protein [Clostridia bacterium]|nr:FtsQ-type POTRA domain-containing protein [Clostridia bacterium]
MQEERNSNKTGERMMSSRRARVTALPKPKVRPKKKAIKTEAEEEGGKKRRSAAFFAVLIIACVAAFLIIMFFVTRVDTITVTGAERYSDESIINLSGLFTGKNLYFYDLDAAKRSIETDPYLKCRGIQRIFPTELNILISERMEFAYIPMGAGSCAVMDETGYVLSIRRENECEGLIPIYGLSSMGFSVGTNIASDKSKLRPYTVMEIIEAVGERSYAIRSIDISNSSSVKLGTVDGVTVMLGDSIDIANKIERMFAILKKLDPARTDGAVIYVNASGTTDISYPTPVPTETPAPTDEPIETDVPAETDEPDDTEEPGGGD